MSHLMRALGAATLCASLVAPTLRGQELPAARAGEALQLQALLTVRDSVARLRNEVARFRRDLPLAGAQTVVNRSRRLTSACTALREALGAGRSTLRAPSGAPVMVGRAAEALQSEMRAMLGTLQSECIIGLRPEGPGEWADTLKAWGPHRTTGIEQGVVRYERAAAAYAKAADIHFPPAGR